MGISKTEINLRRLLVSAPNQQNQAKLIHYVATLREQLEDLGEEKTPEGLPRLSKSQLNDYSEKIEVIASKLAVSEPAVQELEEPSFVTSIGESSSKPREDSPTLSSPRLRRRLVQPHRENSPPNTVEPDRSAAVKLDSASLTHIEKHRKLQEDLTDDMVVLARQLKESSLTMSQSLQNTEKILDSTEKAVENSLASTGHATTRAMGIYSKTSKTTCFTWLLMFMMTCIFIMVVLLIRVT